MIRHVVVFNLKPEVEAADRDWLFGQIEKIIVDVELLEFQVFPFEFVSCDDGGGGLVGAGRPRDDDDLNDAFQVRDFPRRLQNVVSKSFLRKPYQLPDVLAVPAACPVVQAEDAVALVVDIPFQRAPDVVPGDAVPRELQF